MKYFEVGKQYDHLREAEKIKRGLYPRFDSETITRKVRAVCGFLRNGDMQLTDKQWREVMDLCAREYRFRGVPLATSSVMSILEDRCARISQMRQEQESWKKIEPLALAWSNAR